jgi:aldehyde:ferredoxin oxidoreductase
MSGGYTGKTLVVELTKKTTSIDRTDLEDAKHFIGAKGLGAKYLMDHLPKGTNPLSSDNILIFTTGPLTGTSAQTSGRGTVVTKSPLTGLFVDSHFGGIFGNEMKKAGWDFIVINGKSKTPIYLIIKDDKVEFKDAKRIMGLECLKTHDWLQKNIGKLKTAVIGPAGENLVRVACITIDGHRHAGRGGTGAVMGSKNLKAIALTGSGKIPLDNEGGFKNKSKEVRQQVQDNNFVPVRRKYGTPFWVEKINKEGFIPTRNFSEGFFEYGVEINAETMQKRIVDGGGACYNCIIACWNKSSVKQGPFKGTKLIGPEYETIALMGSNLGLKSIEDVAYICDRCNELGMDTISMGGILGFTIEAYNKGIVTKDDLEGIDIGWGKTAELTELLSKIAHRKSKLTKLLGEGIQKASEKLKGESFAVHCKGLDIPGYDPRGTFGMGLAYATSDRGACHQRAWTVNAELKDPELERFSFEKKAKIVKEVQDERAAFFSLVLCDFAPISVDNCVDMWNLSTGFKHTTDSYLECGERIWNIIRLFNLREGLAPGSDILPSRLFNDAFTEGPAKDIVLTKDGFEKSLSEYYKLRGWDEKGVPTTSKLKQLGLDKYQI